MKQQKQQIWVFYKHHYETTLVNENGHTFSFNPEKHEELQDFFMSGKETENNES